MQIAVYAIAKNEAQHVERFAAWTREADMVTVLDTGSEDDTYPLLIGENIRAYQGAITPWRFDVARNTALALVPANVDVCVVADLDEVFEPGWRAKVEAAWTPTTTRLSYPFVSAHNADGSPGTTFRRNLIHARHGYVWKHPCHEIIYPTPGMADVITLCEAVCHHWPDNEKSRGGYLPLLESALIEEPTNPRLMYYLAREYYFHGQHDKAKDLWGQYLQRSDTWVCERAEALRLMAKIAPDREQESWLLRAVTTDPSRRDPWVDLAAWFRAHNNFTGGYYAASQALSITNRMHPFMTYADAWGYRPYDEGSICAYHANAFDVAKAWVKEAIRLAPPEHVDRIKKNARHMGVRTCK